MLEHWLNQDEPVASQPPTWGDLYRPTCFPPPTGSRSQWSPKISRQSRDVQRQQLRDVAARLRDARAEAHGGELGGQLAQGGHPTLVDHPKYKAKMEEIPKFYGDVLSGKPCQHPPVRKGFGEATIPLKQEHRTRSHRDLQMKGER